MNIVGGDIGFKNFKCTCLHKDIEFQFPNIIGKPSPLEIQTTAKSPSNTLKNLSVTYNGQIYYVGEKAEREATNYRYTFLANKVETIDETIKLLTSLGCLKERGLDRVDLFVTGVPVEEYHMIKDKLQTEIVGTYDYEFCGQEYKSTIREVLVVPQGAGDYYDYILTDEGTVVDEKVMAKTLVINIGYRTTEIVTMNHGMFSRNESTTLYTATNSFHKELIRLLVKEYGIRKNLTQIDKIYRDGVVYIKGKEVDIMPLRDKAIEYHINSIIGEIPIWVNVDDVHNILLSGGGSNGLKKFFVEEFGPIVTCLDNPVTGNSRGFNKYGRLVLNARSSGKAVKEAR